jgi:hypothetical protein
MAPYLTYLVFRQDIDSGPHLHRHLLIASLP